MQKIREKSLVIKSEGVIGLLEGENAGKVGKCILESIIGFHDPKLVTFNTPHEPNTRFLKTCQKNEGKICFSPFLFLI